MPFNLHIGGTEIPVGLGLITLTLFVLACINVVTKQVATISGVSFTLMFFTMFALTERYNQKRRTGAHHELEKFRLNFSEDVSSQTVHVRPGNVLVAVRNPSHLEHLQKTLEKTDTRKVDIVALSVHRLSQAASGEHDLDADQIFSSPETEVFTKAVSLAEKAGKHIELLIVAAPDPWIAMVQTAQKLQSARIVTGLSPVYQMNPAEQGQVVGEAWEQLPQPRPSMSLEIVLPDPNQSVYFNLGPHPPRLWPEDVDLVHQLWLELTAKHLGAKLHHRDIIGVALRRLDQQLHSGQEAQVILELEREVQQQHPPEPVGTSNQVG